MHVGDPLTGKRTGGPVWLRREGGGLEATARGAVLHRAPGTPASEQFSAADEPTESGLPGPGGSPRPGPGSP